MPKQPNSRKAVRPVWASRIVGHGTEAPDQLLANPHNWRIHTKEQQDALGDVLDRIGWVQQVVVNQRSGYVVDGHLRCVLAISRNEPMVPVIYVDLTPAEEALALATIDPIAMMAGRNEQLLTDLLAGIQGVVPDTAIAALLDSLKPPSFVVVPETVVAADDGTMMVELICPHCDHDFEYTYEPESEPVAPAPKRKRRK